MSPRAVSPPNARDALTPASALVERFRADLDTLVAPDARVLAAVSGGPDSVAMLLLLHAAIGERCLAATVDHGLRPAAAAEAAWVAALCRRLGIAHETLAAPLPDRAGRTANLSARARTLRYALLEKHRAETDAQHLATAHHADDQVETLVMRLNRGAGLGGLSGIRRRGGHVIRPLLGWRRAELADVVAAAGLDPVDDPSNRDDRYDRARLRKALAGADWLDAERWSRSADALGEAEAALAWATRRLAETSFREEGGALVLSVGDEPAELLRRLVVHGLTRLDPGIAPRGDEVSRLVALILASGSAPVKATLGGVLVTARCDPATGRRATFSPAPPRRSH